MLLGGFGETEFQLVLLRRMADFQPALVEEARERLHRSRTEMRAANAHWQRLVRSPHFPRGPRRYRLVLGEPTAERRQRIGDLPCTAMQWQLPLWPDLRFEVLATTPGAPALQAWLVRAPDTPPPPLRTLADLTPWSCVVSDIDAAFPPVEYREGDAPSRWTSLFTVPDENAAPFAAAAVFVHGLLQTVGPRPDGLGNGDR